MKQILAAIIMAFTMLSVATAADEAPKTRKVCVDVQGKDGKPVVDPKTKKNKQDCKEVKVHKKHEATAVPEKKK